MGKKDGGGDYDGGGGGGRRRAGGVRSFREARATHFGDLPDQRWFGNRRAAVEAHGRGKGTTLWPRRLVLENQWAKRSLGEVSVGLGVTCGGVDRVWSGDGAQRWRASGGKKVGGVGEKVRDGEVVLMMEVGGKGRDGCSELGFGLIGEERGLAKIY